MSRLTYYLLKDPDKLAILTREVRETFGAEAEIRMGEPEFAGLKYLNAYTSHRPHTPLWPELLILTR